MKLLNVRILETLLALALGTQAFTTTVLDSTVGPIRCEFRDPVTKVQYSLAPEQTIVNAVITDGVAQVRLIQTFVNPVNATIQGAYVFPLPHQGSVHSMVYRAGGLDYYAKIMEKQAAISIFDSVQAAGGAAALLLQLTPNIFSQAIANIPALDTVKVMIELSMPLRYTDGTYEFAFPTMVGDRCCSSGASPVYGTITGWNPPANVDGPRVQFNVIVQSNYPVTNLNSPTHPIDSLSVSAAFPTLQLRGVLQSESQLLQTNKFAVMLQQINTYPNSDFVLRYSRAGETQLLTTATYADTDQTHYFMLNMLPDESALTGGRPNLDVMLLVDVSGSQSGWPLNKEIEVTRNILSRLQSTDRVCLMEFDDLQYMAFGDTMRLATPANITLANTFLNTSRGGGSTELYSAITSLVAIPNTEHRQRVYVFLTDGFITNEDAILAYLGKQSPVPQIFAFGAGNSLNRAFLDGVTAIGGGFSTELTSTEDAALAANLAWAKIITPQLTDIQLSFGVMNVTDTLLPQARTLIKGMAFTAYGKSTSSGMQTVTLSGLVNGLRTSFSHSFNLDQGDNLTWAVPKLWAREKIRLLELQDNAGINKKDSIIDISVRYQVLSKYTAFIAYQASATDTLNWGYGATEIKHVQNRASTFNWSGFQMHCSFDAVHFVWDDAQTVEDLRVFDLQGHELYHFVPNGHLHEAVWNTTTAPQNLIVQVKTANGIERRIFRMVVQ